MGAEDYLTKKGTKGPLGRNSQAKALRNTRIQAMAMANVPISEIAAEMDINRSQVNKILNSAETKAIIDQSQSRVTESVTLALNAVIDCLNDPDPNVRLKAAIPLLKTAGIFKDKVDLTLQFPLPTIIRRMNGEEVILTTTAHAEQLKELRQEKELKDDPEETN